MKRILSTLKEKWPEYLLEILVLIIGIYGAFALENWNENRKRLDSEKILLTNILVNLSTDSIQFEYYLNEYKRINELHIQLYEIGINNMLLDSINEPALIRRALYFKQLIGSDFKENVNAISNPKVHKELIQYVNLMADFEDTYYEELLPVIKDQIRPYLTLHEIYNVDNWFKVKSKVFEDYTFKEINGKNIVDQQKLIELSKTIEFQQILYELNLKWSEFHTHLLQVIEVNSQLKTTIRSELKHF